MRTAAFFAMAAAELVAGHATFQFIAKNGGAQTDTGVRGTSNQNNPVLSTAENLASDMMICKGGAAVSGQFEVAGGDKLQLQWHHNTGTVGAGDADEPIATSHHGPIIVWVAPAATKGESGWSKIYEDGLTGTTWAVDKFYANKGIIDVTLPDLAAGDYLIRSEIIALHEGNRAGGAQFYNGCGQITVTSSGSVTLPAGVDIRTVYKTDDAGVLFDIYSGKTSYPIPGPKVLAAGGSPAAPSATKPAATSTKPAATSAAPAQPTTTKVAAPTTAAPSVTKPAATSAAPAKPTTTKVAAPTTLVTSTKPAPTGGASGAVKKYYQCGGKGFTGATACESGSTCKVQNDYYSQCL